MTHEIEFDEESIIGRTIAALGPFGFIAINQCMVNLDDLLSGPRPGKIVRCYADPAKCIMLVPSEDSSLLGCAAGWISDSV